MLPYVEKLEAITDDPWKTHMTLELVLRFREAPLWFWQLQMPRPFVQPPPAKKKKDPNSKTSKKKQDQGKPSSLLVLSDSE